MMEKPARRRASLLGRLWRVFTSPSAHFSLGSILLYGFFAGIVFWGGFHWVVELTNTETFCLSCHEMRTFVAPAVAESQHHANQSGVRATCADCHVPADWGAKIGRKLQMTRELWYHAIGTLDTREKYEAKRLQLAERVWAEMTETGSRECLNCHAYESMDLRLQEGLAARQHVLAIDREVTCIACHKGLAHPLPPGAPDRRLLVDLR